jgi:hypothetical protein
VPPSTAPAVKPSGIGEIDYLEKIYFWVRLIGVATLIAAAAIVYGVIFK